MPALKTTKYSEESDDDSYDGNLPLNMADDSSESEHEGEASGEESEEEEDIEAMKQVKREKGLSNVMKSLLKKSNNKGILSDASKLEKARERNKKKKRDGTLEIVDEASGKNEKIVGKEGKEDETVEQPKKKKLKSDVSSKIRQDPRTDTDVVLEKKYKTLATKGVVDLLNFLRQQEDGTSDIKKPSSVHSTAITQEASAMNCGKIGLLKLLSEDKPDEEAD